MRSRPFQRQSYRLHGHDYAAPGAYFVTICAFEKQMLFGNITNQTMTLSEIGKTVSKKWGSLLRHFPNIELDQFIVMPNHVHGVIWIKPREALAHCRGAINRAPTLGEIIRTFKAVTTYEIREKKLEYAIWQRSYHDRIIRNERELFAIRNYIKNNPNNWESDEYASGLTH